MTKLVLLGTYWNELEWIDKSLAQIERISPDMVILCDGCFDSSQKNRSVDGTRDKIYEFCSEKKNYFTFSASRNSRFKSICYLLKVAFSKKYSISLFYLLMKHAIRTNKYRLNQAVTFTKMLEMAVQELGEDIWFMTYDADQFYDDSYVSNIKDIINSLNDNTGLLTAQELTFNNDYSHCTDRYEARTWNNLPHKYYSNTMIMPTRDILLLKFFSVAKYIDSVEKSQLGVYYHYKFRTDVLRDEMTYKLGDRKAPLKNRTNKEKDFLGSHPEVVSKK